MVHVVHGQLSAAVPREDASCEPDVRENDAANSRRLHAFLSLSLSPFLQSECIMLPPGERGDQR